MRLLKNRLRNCLGPQRMNFWVRCGKMSQLLMGASHISPPTASWDTVLSLITPLSACKGTIITSIHFVMYLPLCHLNHYKTCHTEASGFFIGTEKYFPSDRPGKLNVNGCRRHLTLQWKCSRYTCKSRSFSCSFIIV